MAPWCGVRPPRRFLALFFGAGWIRCSLGWSSVEKRFKRQVSSSKLNLGRFQWDHRMWMWLEGRMVGWLDDVRVRVFKKAQHCRIPRREGSEFTKGRRFRSVIWCSVPSKRWVRGATRQLCFQSWCYTMLHICLHTYFYTFKKYTYCIYIYIYYEHTANIWRYRGVFGAEFLGQWSQEPPPPPEQEEEVEDPEACVIVWPHG